MRCRWGGRLYRNVRVSYRGYSSWVDSDKEKEKQKQKRKQGGRRRVA